jgi:replicative DNA helicase
MSDVLPQNPEAEQSVLGAMMISGGAIDAVTDVLDPADFYLESHGLIFHAASQIHGRGEPVDPITLVAELERTGQIGNVGGKVRVHEIARLVPTSSNAKHYAEIVKDKSTARGLIRAGMEITRLGQEESQRGVERAEELVSKLAPQHTNHSTVFTAEQVATGFREKMAEAHNFMGEETIGVPAPWSFLRPLRASRLYTLAGYTSDGKSASALQFFSTACIAQARPMLVTNEMSEEDLTSRLISQAGVPHHMCDSGIVDARYRPVMESRLGEIEGWDFRLVDDESIGLKGIRRQVKLYRPGFLIVDHLHQFGWTERRELEMLILGFRSLAREYEIPVLLLAQLNRSGDYKEPFPRPSLPRLKETSMLEQASDTVWFVWRPRDEYYQPGEHTEFLVAKNRGGSLEVEPGMNYANMKFVPQFVRFDEKGQS